MTNPDNIFLTENRRNVLKGTSDWEQASIQNEKSRIKARAQLALDELIEVAESPHIDQTQVFDPDDVFWFLRALLTPEQQHLKPGDLSDDDFTHIASRDKYTAEFATYSDQLELQMSKLILSNDD